MVLGRLDQNSGFHLQQKDPIDLQFGVNIVSLLTCLILVKACSYFQVSRTYIKYGPVSILGQICIITYTSSELLDIESSKCPNLTLFGIIVLSVI